VPNGPAASKIRDLVAQGDLSAALDCLTEVIRHAGADLTNEVLLLRSRATALRRAERTGTLAANDTDLQWNRIRLALLDLVDDLPPETQGWDAFLSYRRADGAEVARLLRAKMAERHRRLFLDVEDLGPGRFGDDLLEAIRATPAFVPLLSPNCLARVAQSGDWFAEEIRCAIESGRRIIPIRMPGFEFPEGLALPAAVASLQDRQSVNYSHEYFEATLNLLDRYLA